jgi:hypothetical protein
MLELGLDGRLPHFQIDLGRIGHAVDLVLSTARRSYPDYSIPFHSRWRHFVIGGVDRWEAIAKEVHWRNAHERARAEFDLAMISVFLDAGSGPAWRYRDAATGTRIGRSEGLALATLDMFARGVFSARGNEPLRADATVLKDLTVADLRTGFQVTDKNQLVGLEGRAGLLRRLGMQVLANPQTFARSDDGRPGGLYDWLRTGEERAIAATVILTELLREMGPIWPSRLSLGGVPLGDCWHHPALGSNDAASGLMPLHKLSQWLAYSLIEPVQRAGLDVTDIDGLTGLAEYRNGGLFVDCGVLVLRDPREMLRDHDVASPLAVEWRALTVALLDRVADEMRRRTGLDAISLPLARVLEGGTWSAGRAIAFERRPDGSPPIKVISDGTVF